MLQSKAFWCYAAPLFHEAFPHTKEASPEDFYRAINRVQPGLIRVEADELSYPFHVFLRYDVERALFAGELDVATIPQQWNAYMKERLDVDVPVLRRERGRELRVEINQCVGAMAMMSRRWRGAPSKFDFHAGPAHGPSAP